MKAFINALHNVLSTPNRPQQTVRHVAVQEIPSEIWELVALHLSPKDLWNLRSLNSTFLALALNAKYESTHIARMTKSVAGFRTQLKRLQDPFISCRIRSLTIKSDAHIGNITTLPPWLRSIRYSRVASYAKQEKAASTWAARGLQNQVQIVVEQLPIITSLTVLYEPITSPYMDVVWRRFSHSITSLTLHLGTVGCSHFLALDPSIKCPNVRSFTLYCSQPRSIRPGTSIDRNGCPILFHGSGSQWDDLLYEKSAAQIVSMIPKELTELCLHDYSCCETRCTVLLRPENFPMLTSFSCRARYVDAGHGHVLTNFINAHKLKSLDCSRGSLESLHLKGIRSLIINDWHFSQNFGSDLRVSPLADLTSLQRLELNVEGYVVVWVDIYALFTSPLTSAWNLRDLSLSFNCSLDLHLLLGVARHLSHLHTLFLAEVRSMDPSLADICDGFKELWSAQSPTKGASVRFTGLDKELGAVHLLMDRYAVVPAFSRCMSFDFV